MKTITQKIIVISAVALLFATTLYFSMSYNPESDLEVKYPAYQVSNFVSYDDLDDFLLTGSQLQNNNYLYNTEAPAALRDESSNEENKADGESLDISYDSSGSSSLISEVDEADIVKTDGTYLYVLTYGYVDIISAYPSENAEIVSKITFEESRNPRNIFINSDSLAIITQSYLYRTYEGSSNEGTEVSELKDDGVWQETISTHVELYDISDRQNPVKVRDVAIDGYYYTASMVDGYVYVITTQYSYEPVLYKDSTSSYIPSICIDEKVEPIGLSSIYYVDDPYLSKTLTHVVSVNINDATADVYAEVFLIGDPSAIYVSTDSIFIASSSYIYDYTIIQDLLKEYVLPALPAKATDEVNTVDSLTLEDYQKTTVIGWILQSYVNDLSEQQKITIGKQLISKLQMTNIHKITIEKGDITYSLQATIPGVINNLDSISEYNGYLRVVTSLNGWAVSSYLTYFESYSNLYILDDQLDIVGSIESLENGYSISSVQFIENTCFINTYDETGTILTIDLSNPEKPEIAGTLDITGYSSFIYPYDDSHIIGIGQENNMIVLHLFNIEDISNPQEISNYQIKPENEEMYWSYSNVFYDHQSFYFNQEKNLLILPASVDYSESAYVFDLTDMNIELVGELTHPLEESEKELYEPDYIKERYYYGYSIHRSLIIEDVIYTISDAMILMHDIETLNELNSISLR